MSAQRNEAEIIKEIPDANALQPGVTYLSVADATSFATNWYGVNGACWRIYDVTARAAASAAGGRTGNDSPMASPNTRNAYNVFRGAACPLA